MPAPNPAFGLGPSDGNNYNHRRRRYWALILDAGVLEPVADYLNTAEQHWN